MSHAERLDDRQHPFRESASRLVVATERALPPEHPAAAEDPLGKIVRRLDPLAPREQPQSRIQRQQVLAEGRRLRVGAATTRLQRGAEVAGDGVQRRLVDWLGRRRVVMRATPVRRD